MIWQVVVASLRGSSVLFYCLQNNICVFTTCLEADNHELFHSFLSGQHYFERAQSRPLYFHVRRWVIMFSGSIRALCANKPFRPLPTALVHDSWLYHWGIMTSLFVSVRVIKFSCVMCTHPHLPVGSNSMHMQLAGWALMVCSNFNSGQLWKGYGMKQMISQHSRKSCIWIPKQWYS